MLVTHAFPAERAPQAEVQASLQMFLAQPLTRALLDATDVTVAVLNQHRQIIAGNSALLASLNQEQLQQVAGMRPGEALGCIHARQCPGGCGTAPECNACGAALAITTSQQTGKTVERECLMTLEREGHMVALELRVKASQIDLDGARYTVVGLRDISAEKRRDAIDRVFLHDLANTLGSLLNCSHVLRAKAPAALGETAHRIDVLAHRLKRELEEQRVLLLAQDGSLEVRRTEVLPQDAIESAASLLADHPVARGRALLVMPAKAAQPVFTDESLLVRVLVNMMKNALEATAEGGTVKAWAEPSGDGCELRVWNASAIDPKVGYQIFKRSFSTKSGTGRGLGTFGMKLLVEQYLGGTVSFRSNAEEGTTFIARLPVS